MKISNIDVRALIMLSVQWGKRPWHPIPMLQLSNSSQTDETEPDSFEKMNDARILGQLMPTKFIQDLLLLICRGTFNRSLDNLYSTVGDIDIYGVESSHGAIIE